MLQYERSGICNNHIYLTRKLRYKKDLLGAEDFQQDYGMLGGRMINPSHLVIKQVCNCKYDLN
jgi:hypothetical protein